jgi:putative peptidoglycan lipid II flippase
MRLLRSSAIVGGFTMISRVLGLVRDMLLAARLGAGPVADAFFVALQFPNLFRRIFAEGAFNAAFVPLYAGRLEEKGEDEAGRFAREVLSVLTTSVLAIVVIAQIAMPWLMYALGPGFIQDPDLFAFAVLLTQITMPYLLCMSIAAMLSGALNSHERFASAAAAPILLNIVLISILAWGPGSYGSLAWLLCIGVTFSGILQVIWLVGAARRAGVKLGLAAPRLTPAVKRLLILGVPGAAAAGVTHINQLVASSIATLQEGARSWIYYADRLYQLPLGVIGIAMGVALLPALSKRLRAGAEDEANGGLNRALEISMALTLPAAAALFVIPDLIVSGLLERGAFEETARINTSIAVMIYAAGLPAFVMIKVFSPGFFAREDTVTPMKFAAIAVVLNLVVGVTLFFSPNIVPGLAALEGYRFAGLALATTLAGWLNALLLAGTLVQRKQYRMDPRMVNRLPRILGAVVIMAVSLWMLDRYARAWGEQLFAR